MNPATVALIFLILSLFLWLFLIVAPWIINKIFPSFTLKKWVKHLLSISSGVIGAVVVLLLFIIWAVSSFFNPSRRPIYARMFLEDCAINVELLPKFKVLDHTFRITGGSDTEEKWEILFKKPLSEEFLASLNRLCEQSSSNWRYDYQGEFYVFSCWRNAVITETVIIYPKTQSAVLSHVKI